MQKRVEGGRNQDGMTDGKVELQRDTARSIGGQIGRDEKTSEREGEQ